MSTHQDSTADELTPEEMSKRVKEAAAARPPKPKRFYKSASVAVVEGGFAIQLDGRTAKTPKRESLIVPTEALAKAVASEWDAQVKEINAEKMPLTQIANTAIDGVSQTRDEVLKTLTDYARHDLLCYQVAYPETLAAQQRSVWGGILDWAEKALGVRMETTTGIVSIQQPETSITAIQKALAQFDAWELTATFSLAGTYKSVLLALAVMKGHISAQEAHAATLLDEDFQNTIWGVDAEAKSRNDKLGAEAVAAETFASLLIAG